MKDNPYTIRSSEIAWSCPWWKVRHDEITVNGKNGDFFYVDNTPSIVVVPVTSDGEIIMIKQYRHPVKDWCWEVVAGSIEEGQSPEDAVRDELKEEIGGTAKDIVKVASFFNTNGSSNEQSLVFLATSVEIGDHDRNFMEIMEVHMKSIDEALNMAKNGEITDAVSALALLLCENKINGLYKT